jgi:hypothetical protein
MSQIKASITPDTKADTLQSGALSAAKVVVSQRKAANSGDGSSAGSGDLSTATKAFKAHEEGTKDMSSEALTVCKTLMPFRGEK